MMKAFVNTEMTRDKLKQRVYEHHRLDEIVKGIYWEEGKGCLVGCWTHSGNHELFPKLFGIPEVISQLADRIFETLPNSDAKQFVLDVFESIKEGADLRLVWPKFAVWLLVDPECGVIKYNDCKEIKDVANLYQRIIDGEDVPAEEFKRAATAAYSARAYAAAVLSDVAARATAADIASVDADYSALASAAAAFAHADGAENRTEHALKQRDMFLKLLMECK